VLADPGRAAERYRAGLAANHLPYHRITATIQASLVDRPRAVAGTARLLTILARSNLLSGGWSVFWNELLHGAPANSHRTIAAMVTWLGQKMTGGSSVAHWFEDHDLRDPEHDPFTWREDEIRMARRGRSLSSR